MTTLTTRRSVVNLVSMKKPPDPRKRLQKWRSDNGLSYAEAAERLGCEKGNLNRIERGMRGPGAQLRATMERVVNIPAWTWGVWPGKGTRDAS